MKLSIAVLACLLGSLSAQRRGPYASQQPTPAPQPQTTTERDFESMSLFSLLEEVMNDSGPTGYAYDEPSSSSSQDYPDEQRIPDKETLNVYDEPKIMVTQEQQQHKNTNAYSSNERHSERYPDPIAAAQEFAGQSSFVEDANPGPNVIPKNVTEVLPLPPKTPAITHMELKVPPQETIQRKPISTTHEEPKVNPQNSVPQKPVSIPKQETKPQAYESNQKKENVNNQGEQKVIPQEYIQPRPPVQNTQTNVFLKEDVKPSTTSTTTTTTTTTRRTTQQPKTSTTLRLEGTKTTTPLYVDPEPLPLSKYRIPVHYTFNNGEPFYLEKDPVTGDLDFESKKLQLQNVPVSLRNDDYYYADEDEESDGIDRKDGKILTSPGDKNNPFNNLPLNYNDFKKVNDYSNHKTQYSDFPLISSSYANTKVQGTAGEKIMNHKPYPTSSTHSPSYYTMKPKPSTTESAHRDYDYGDGESKPVKIPSFGDKIQKRPTTQVTTTSRRPTTTQRPSSTDVYKRPGSYTQAPGSQQNRRPAADSASSGSAKVETVYSKRPTDEYFSEYDSQYNREPIADRPLNAFDTEPSRSTRRPTIGTSSESYHPNKNVPSRTSSSPKTPSQNNQISQDKYRTTTQSYPSTKPQTVKITTTSTKLPVRDSNFAGSEGSLEESQSEDYEYYDSQSEAPVQNFVTPQKTENNKKESSTDHHKTGPQQFTSSTEFSRDRSTEQNVFPTTTKYNTEFAIHHIAAQQNSQATPLAVRPPQTSTGYKVVEDVEVEPAGQTSSTTRRPLVGSIVYAEQADKTSTFPSIVYSESVTKLPGNVITSMPLGTSFQFNRPNTGSQFLHPTRQDVKPAASNFVAHVDSNTGPSFTQGGKESAYGIFGEEPFRPIFGPGDKSAEGLSINPGPNLVVPKIPQETPNRWNYPNAPISSDTFFQMKPEKTESPPKIPGVEPPNKKPVPFLREPTSPWGNSQQLFQVSSHVKFPAESQDATDNIAEEGHTAPPAFKQPLPPQRPNIYQTIPQQHYQQPIRGALHRPAGIPDAPPRVQFHGAKRPMDEDFDRETGVPTVPSRDPIGPSTLGEGFPNRGKPVAAFNILLKEVVHPQKPTNENVPQRIQGSAVNVPLRDGPLPPRPNFPQDQNLNIPIGVNIVNVGSQGPTPPQGDDKATVKPKDELAIPGEIPNLPMTPMEGKPPFMNEPAGILQPPRPAWERPGPGPGPRPNPNQFYRKPFPPTRRHGPNNLPNILPQFRPNAKVSHHEGNRIGYFPQRQPLLERPRPVSDHLIPPPTRLRNRNDNVDELIAYDAYHHSPPGPILHRPFVHRRAGPHVDHHNPRPQTLQMIQQFPRQPQLPRDNLIKDPERPVFVVYPSKQGPVGKPNPDKEVVVGIRGEHLPVPPADLSTEDEIMSGIPYQHNKNQTPLLQPAKERTERPKPVTSTQRPMKHDFPYELVEPEENAEDESEEGHTEVAKSSIDETIEAEVYNNHPPNHEDTEINVIPYLQDYMPFGTRKTTVAKPTEPVTVADNQWTYDKRNENGKTSTKANLTDDHISVTLKTVSTSNSSPSINQVSTTLGPFKITDYPRPGEKGSAHHKTVVASEGSEFTLSAVMHTIPQSGSDTNKRKDTLHADVVHASSPNLHLPQNHNNGEKVATLSQSFQAPFLASANVGAGWNILASDKRMKPGTVDKAELDRKDTATTLSSDSPSFDFENFKPQLFGGFKPIYNVPEEGSSVKRPQPTEREEKKLL